ncbi:MAG: DUF192 domain-containing protein [Alphaproteobacteria bacterium]|nr:DUF192 domain-containing protein [Alphaproteobacteria bacterium]
MKRLFIVFAIILTGICLYPRFSNLNNKQQISFERKNFEIQKENGEHISLSLEIADTDERRQHGLMNRTHINGGMLFIFNPPRLVTMWMKNTPSSLDMIFIDENKIIHRIAPNTQPFSTEVISSEIKTKFVIELPANDAQRLNIQIGDKLAEF